jgi:uncharacterized protein (DUF1501 family)
MQASAAALGTSAFPLDVFAAPVAPSDRALLLIQLAGGNDGLNTVLPLGDPLYAKLRPTVGLTADETLDVGGPLALHGALAPLAPRFKDGQVAVIQGVGYPKPSRSHFESIAVWQSGELKPKAGLGWVGRALEAASSSSFTLTSIGGGGTSPALWTVKRPAAALASLDAFAAKPDQRAPGDAPALLKALVAMYAQPQGTEPNLAAVRRVGSTALSASDELKRAVTTYASKANYPRGGFGDQLKLAVQMLAAPLGVRAAHVVLGGFDTHANQKRQHQTLLGSLADGITAALGDAEVHGLGDRLVVMTYSEFGRRAAENGSGGTDHGAGSVMLLAGAPVVGGFYGQSAELAHLDQGDVPCTSDFRAIYASVLEDGFALKSSFDVKPLRPAILRASTR